MYKVEYSKNLASINLSQCRNGKIYRQIFKFNILDLKTSLVLLLLPDHFGIVSTHGIERTLFTYGALLVAIIPVMQIELDLRLFK